MKELRRSRSSLRRHRTSSFPDGPRCPVDETRGTGIVGYNVQTAVDATHHLIVAHEVTNVGIDRDQLTQWRSLARDAMGTDDFTVIADRVTSRVRKSLPAMRRESPCRSEVDHLQRGRARWTLSTSRFHLRTPREVNTVASGQQLIWRVLQASNEAEASPLLEFALPAMRDQGQMYSQHRKAHYPLGA